MAIIRVGIIVLVKIYLSYSIFYEIILRLKGQILISWKKESALIISHYFLNKNKMIIILSSMIFFIIILGCFFVYAQ